MVVTEIRSKAEFTDAIAEDKLSVLDCYAMWCGPCKMISPKFEGFSDKHTEANFLKFNVDEVPDLAQELGIRAMPTFIFFRKGEKITDLVGANPSALENLIIEKKE